EDAPPMSMPPSTLSPRAYRLTGLRPSSIPPPPERELMMTLADVLMAAASADGEVCHRERRTIHRIFTRLLEQPSLPPWLEEHMRSFELEKFQLNAAAEALRNISPPQRRHIVELVRQVCDANN